MGMFLSAMSENAYKEYILPQINNMNYDLTLEESVFGCPGDIRLNFEIINGQWRFLGLEDNHFLTPQSLKPGETLSTEKTIQLQFGSRTDSKIFIMFMETSFQLDNLARIRIKNATVISIGSALDNNIIYSYLNRVSKHHAVLNVSADSCVVIDNSPNGVFVGSNRVMGKQELMFGDVVNIFGLRIVWLGNVLAIGWMGGSLKLDGKVFAVLKPSEYVSFSSGMPMRVGSEELFKRSPRSIPVLESDEVEIEGPPQLQRSAKRPLLLTIGPSLTMAIPMGLGTAMSIISAQQGGRAAGALMYTGIVIAVTSAVIGAMWAIINLNYTKKQEAGNEKLRSTRYKEYLNDKDKELKDSYDKNGELLRALYPSSEKLALYTGESRNLWNRNTTHVDFLYVRLGTGSMPFQVPINIPKERFSLYDDELEKAPAIIRDKYSILKDVPMGVDLLDKRIIGVIGTDGLMPVIRSMVVQLAAANCYTEVKMAFLYDEVEGGSSVDWSFARWLPHVWSEDRDTRYIAAGKTERTETCYALTEILRTRAEMQNSSVTNARFLPHYIVFVQKSDYIESEPVAKYLLQTEGSLGVTTVILSDSYFNLPNVCTDIIQNDNFFRGVFNTEEGDSSRREIIFDSVSAKQAESFARNISCVQVGEFEAGGELPGSLTFLEMYGVNLISELNVISRWVKNRTYDSMRVPVGVKSGGSLWYLDIHEKFHGPHGLVAGTTGSGKSETLQTYLLSLAVNYSPDDVSFFIIDFKGGGMANLFHGLPHLAGQISNLSGNQVNRAMVSIKSENRRRQRIFAEYGVNHINQYTKLVKNGDASQPIPHLIIVIDEFAELKREQPDFMQELISVAQVGRSLGVHLILSTQKPSGTVDDNIWSNAKFKLCLRVQDRQDSNDMLHKPDAAYLTQAGRCYIQVGNDEIYELFQSGWSGADYDEESIDINTDIASIRSNDGKPAVVGSYLKMKYRDKKQRAWLSELAGLILDECGKMKCGVVDCSRSPSMLDALASGVIIALADRSVEYSTNRSAVNRLKAFITALAVTKPEDSVEERAIKAAAVMVKNKSQLPETLGRSQLSALVEYLAKLAHDNGYSANNALWLPELPTQLYLDQLEECSAGTFSRGGWSSGGEWSLNAHVGLADDPANQSQPEVVVDLAENGHLAVCGNVFSGKSVFIQTLLYALADKYSPDCINFYILDFSSHALACFDALVHTGGVMFEGDDDKIQRLFIMLSKIIAQRKKLFVGGNYRQYVRIHGMTMPAIVVAMDDVASFREKTSGKFDAIMSSLVHEGLTYGIYFVLSAAGFGSSGIPNSIANNISNSVCLEMSDKYKYMDVLKASRIDSLPESGVQGRGLTTVGGRTLEFQTALAVQAGDDYARTEMMGKIFEKMNRAWKGDSALKVPDIPEQPTLEIFMENSDVKAAWSSNSLLPFGYCQDDASICSMELNAALFWLIIGRAGSGKTNLLGIMLACAAMKKAKVAVFDFDDAGLSASTQKFGGEYIHDAAGAYDYFKRLIEETIGPRGAVKKEMKDKGKDTEAIFKKMTEYDPYFIFIDDLKKFLETAYFPGGDVGSMSAFLENFAKNGRLYNIFIIAAVNSAELSSVKSQFKTFFDNMTANKNGIVMGGNVDEQSMFDFSTMAYSERTRRLRAGVGLLPSPDGVLPVRRIVIPRVK